MEACKEHYEKLIFFDDLEDDEKAKVKQHTDSCETCRNQLLEFQRIMTSLRNVQQRDHLDHDLLVRYSIHLAEPGISDYDGRKLTQAEIGTIQTHLTSCPCCQGHVEDLGQQYREIEAYLESTDLPSVSLGGEPTRAFSPQKLKGLLQAARDVINEAADSIRGALSAPIPKFYPVAVGTLAALVVAIWIGPFFTSSSNPYLHLSSLENEKFSFVKRSASLNRLNEGLSAFHNRNYDKAIEALQLAIASRGAEANSFYAHLVLGTSYLIKAKDDLLGYFEKIDPELVRQGMQHLHDAQGLADNAGQQEECTWFIAKAHLMLGDKESATKYFNKIIELHGRRYRDAQELLGALDAVQ